MSCFHPMQGWRSRSLNKNGKREFTTDRNNAFVDMPMTLPCGNCLDCRLKSSRDWAIRIMHECKSHEKNIFITLTYASAPDNFSLNKTDFQGFIKRLRRRFGKVRYYQCGEYGEKFGRPHHHAILFGFDFPDKKKKPKKEHENQFYSSKLLEDIWRHGRCDISDVTYDSAAYVSGYITKKVNGDMAPIHYSSIDYETGEVLFTRVPESATMSLKPAIGFEFYQKYKNTPALFVHDRVIMKGKEFPIPRYYDKLFEKEYPELMMRIKAKRRIKALERIERNPDDFTPDRQEVKNWVKQVNFNAKVRKFEVDL